jgi:hypothetical protein
MMPSIDGRKLWKHGLINEIGWGGTDKELLIVIAELYRPLLRIP